MPKAHVKVAGAWKTLDPKVKVASVWKTVNTGHVKVAGAWKAFYQNLRVVLSGSSGTPNTDSDFSAGGTAQAGWSFASTGDLTKHSGAAWAQPEWFGSPGDTVHSTPDQTYYIRATLDSGSAPDSGPALGVWASLGNRLWYWEAGPGFDSSAGTLKIEIASDAGGTDIVATGYYAGDATAEP